MWSIANRRVKYRRRYTKSTLLSLEEARLDIFKDLKYYPYIIDLRVETILLRKPIRKLLIPYPIKY